MVGTNGRRLARLALATVALVSVTSACGGSGGKTKLHGALDANQSSVETTEPPAGGGAPAKHARTSVTFDPRGEASGLHCGLPTATVPKEAGTPPSTAFPEPVNDFPLSAKLSPSRGDPGTKLKVSVSAGRPRALIVVFAVWSDAKDHGTRMADFSDVAGHAEFTTRVPAGLPPGQANIVVSANFTVGDHTDSALVREHYIVTGPGCP